MLKVALLIEVQTRLGFAGSALVRAFFQRFEFNVDGVDDEALLVSAAIPYLGLRNIVDRPTLEMSAPCGSTKVIFGAHRFIVLVWNRSSGE